MFDWWSILLWEYILFWKTDTKRGFYAHILYKSLVEKKTVFAPFFLSNFSLLPPQYIYKPHPVGLSSKHSSARAKEPKKCSLKISCYLLPFVDGENKQLLWQTPLARCTIPSFLILKLNSRPRDIFGPDSFSLSEINWNHPFVGQKRFFCRKKFFSPTNQ